MGDYSLYHSLYCRCYMLFAWTNNGQSYYFTLFTLDVFIFASAGIFSILEVILIVRWIQFYKSIRTVILYALGIDFIVEILLFHWMRNEIRFAVRINSVVCLLCVWLVALVCKFSFPSIMFFISYSSLFSIILVFVCSHLIVFTLHRDYTIVNGCYSSIDFYPYLAGVNGASSMLMRSFEGYFTNLLTSLQDVLSV